MTSYQLRATTVEEIISELAAIPANVTRLNLGRNGLNNKTAAELAQIFAAIPPSVTSLDLGLNDLHYKTATELAQVFAAIPASVTSLNLGVNELGRKTAAELVQVVAAIPPNVTSLNLGQNELYHKTADELVEVVAAIPPNVTSLHLGENGFGITIASIASELAQVFAAIQPSVTSLCLGQNGLHLRYNGAAELAQIFTAIPPTVTSLHLGENTLGSKTAAELTQVFAAIPPNVTSIHIGRNVLYRKTAAELAKVFAALPPNVTHLDLGENRLDDSIDQLTNLLLKLPASIPIVTVNGKSAFSVDHLLDSLFPTAIRPDFFDNPYPDPIEPNLTIDNSLLIEMISYLQRYRYPMGSLVTAMLLDGKIATACTETQAHDTEYATKRALAAIPFYRKAACDPDLEPHIKFLLWHDRATTDNPAIKQALSQYRLSPAKFAPTFTLFKEAAQLIQPNDLLDLADHSETQPITIDSLAELIGDAPEHSLMSSYCIIS